MTPRLTRRAALAGVATGTVAPLSSAASRGADGMQAAPSSASIASAAASMPFVQAGGGAITRSLLDKARETVSLADFGPLDPGRDSTDALHRAIASLGADGGIVEIPPGVWAVNAVIAQNNITLRGKGGGGEFRRACLRPFSLRKPTLTFGDDARDVYYCGLQNVHVSGASGSDASVHASAQNAPQALLLRGGVMQFVALNCVFYNGVQTVALVPSQSAAVTTNRFISCQIRNDISDSAAVRGLYLLNRNEAGYNTANSFIATKLNGPPSGFAAEARAIEGGIPLELNDCYWDVRPDHGILLRGVAYIVAHNFKLDPGAHDVVIIETDESGSNEPARFIKGMIRHGGQKMKFGDGSTVSIPAEADNFSVKSRIIQPFFGDTGYFASRASPYSTKVYYDWETNDGPMRWHGIRHRFMDKTEAEPDLTHAALQTEGGLAAKKSIRAGGEIHSNRGYFVGGVQVLGARQEAIASPRGGQIVDIEARRTIEALLAKLKAHGLLA